MATPSAPYRHAPLVLALLEVKHPETDTLTRGALAGLKSALVRSLPLQSSEDQALVQFAVVPGAPPGAAPQPRMRTVHRFLSRNKKTSASFTPDSFSIETTEYQGWDWFRGLITLVASALADIAPVDGVQRIGLRYIDEIRIPGPESESPDWSTWIHRDLQAPGSFGLGIHPVQQQAVVQYATDDPAETVTLRYGAVVGPPAVGEGSLVRSPAPARGHYFLLDTDAAWEVVAGEPVPEFDVTHLAATADRLHGPVKELFESALTERLREEVLNAE